jgi:hypothetical protein
MTPRRRAELLALLQLIAGVLAAFSIAWFIWLFDELARWLATR